MDTPSFLTMVIALFAITGFIAIIPIFANAAIIVALDFLATPIVRLIGAEGLLVTDTAVGLSSSRSRSAAWRVRCRFSFPALLEHTDMKCAFVFAAAITLGLVQSASAQAVAGDATSERWRHHRSFNGRRTRWDRLL